jgi:DNA-directed RNA polymerase specialized sigma24 family protein
VTEPPIPEGELDLWSRYKRKQLLEAGADLTDAEDFYYFAAERVAHGEALVSSQPPEPRHLEMLRLRFLEGLTLREVGERTGVNGTTVLQLLGHYFGVRGVPPAAKTRRKKK